MYTVSKKKEREYSCSDMFTHLQYKEFLFFINATEQKWGTLLVLGELMTLKSRQLFGTLTSTGAISDCFALYDFLCIFVCFVVM